MPKPALRASDDDRDSVLHSLERHFAAGRITPEEFDQRSTEALVAVTLTDLTELTDDLPEVTGGPPPPGVRTGNPHHLVLAFVIAFATLAVVVAMMLLHP